MDRFVASELIEEKGRRVSRMYFKKMLLIAQKVTVETRFEKVNPRAFRKNVSEVVIF